MPIELRDLEIFCRVVEAESFSRAARVVALSQARVSERIARLERCLGAPLLDRLGRKAVPTRVGQHVYRSAVELIARGDRLAREVQELLELKRGHLVIGASTTPAEVYLPGEIARFRARYPDVIVRVRVAGSGEIVRQALAGEIELGVVGARIPDRRLRYRALWTDEIVLAVPPAHPWANKRSARLSTLAGAELVAREPTSGTRRVFEAHLAGAGIDPASLVIATELGSAAAVKEAVKSGVGVAAVSARACRADVEAGWLSALRLSPRLSRAFYLVRNTAQSLSPLARAFRDSLPSER